MLSKIGENGEFYEVKEIPFVKNFDRWVSKFPAGSYDAVCTFLSNSIANEEKFSVGSLVPKIWDAPLIEIYHTAEEDELTAAFLLGSIVLKLAIDDESQHWLCTKTSLQGRDIQTNFYWRKN